MRIKILLAVLLFSVAAHAQTDTTKKHFHSWSLNKDVTENYKDSASKYFTIEKIYMDSAREQQGLGNQLHFRYYARKAVEASIKSFKYAEKQ